MTREKMYRHCAESGKTGVSAELFGFSNEPLFVGRVVLPEATGVMRPCRYYNADD
jgi:hypothetical protein